MQLIRGQHNLPKCLPTAPAFPCVATIGNFDGVHLGHQAVLHQLQDAAQTLDGHAWVILFEPQPKEFFKQQHAPIRLQTLREKLHCLKNYGVSNVLCLYFNAALSHLSREDFIQQLLIKRLNVRHLIVGDDFRFGRHRSGDYAFLKRYGQSWGLEITQAATVDHQGHRISSTAVREALQAGSLAQATALLARPYSLSGKVIQGRQLGRTLGFPTANLLIKRDRFPLHGVFLTRVHNRSQPIADLWPLPGVANLGYKPTLEDNNGRNEQTDKKSANLEIHLLLPEGTRVECYHQRLEVEFLAHLRAEQKFDSLTALQAQIAQDIAWAHTKWQQLKSNSDTRL